MTRLPSFRIKAGKHFPQQAIPSPETWVTALAVNSPTDVGQRLVPNLGNTPQELDEGVDYFQHEADKARLSIRLKELLGGNK